MSLHVIILAAGFGKRMYSSTPKVLHQVGGVSMFERVAKAAMQLNPEKIHAIIGHQAEQIQSAFPTLPIHWIKQDQQLGTGHAVMQAIPYIPDDALVLVLYADLPLTQTNTLQALIKQCEHVPSLGLLLTKMPDPFGLGRILRDEYQQIKAIIEEKDANEQQREINEIYSGICCVRATDLKRWLPKLNNNNAQQEYYLTDIITMAVHDDLPIHSLQAHYMEVYGVNNRAQLQLVERTWQQQLAQQLMTKGTTLADANRIDIRGELTCGRDVFIDVNNVFQGTIILGDNCIIGSNCVLTNVTLEANCQIHPNSVLEDCVIGENSQVGPFARIRPGTRLGANCKIGNFVEAKNAILGKGSKANHLSYLGDVTIGAEVNIGAGTITCNYDGANKHHTIIEDGVHIGSDTQLIAPIRVGKNATIGAGSTIRKDVPPDELTLTVSTQKTVAGWKRPVKKEK